MIRVVHGVAWFPDKEHAEILQLMLDQSSCARSAYQAYHKLGITKFKDLYAHLKKNYGHRLKAIQRVRRWMERHLTN